MKKILTAAFAALTLGSMALAPVGVQAEKTATVPVSGVVEGTIAVEFPQKFTLTNDRAAVSDTEVRLSGRGNIAVTTNYHEVKIHGQSTFLDGPADQKIPLRNSTKWENLSHQHEAFLYFDAPGDSRNIEWLAVSTLNSGANGGWQAFAGTYTGAIDFTLTYQ